MLNQDSLGILIGAISVVGGLTVGAIAVGVAVPWSMREKMARQEAAHRERLALIEKGYDPEQVFKHKKAQGSDPLLWGCLIAGMGFGVLSGYLLSVAMGWTKEILTNAMGLLMGGLGLIVYNFIHKKPQE